MAAPRRDDGLDEVDRVVAETAADLESLQNEAGEWCFELEADVTIPAEYILLEHFLDAIDDDVERKLAVYLRATQADHGGWPLFHGGEFNISASVKAYYALKLTGDDPAAPHMVRGTRGHPRPRRCGQGQRLHPLGSRPLRPGALARGAGDAAGDHAAAEDRAVPPEQSFLLVARRDRAASDPDGAEAARRQSAPHRHP
jgi:hypothetical protein